MSVQVVSRIKSSKNLALILGCAALMTACASHRERTIPTWGGDRVEPRVAQSDVIYTPPQTVVSQPVATPFSGRTTFTQGCSGNFSVRDIQTNRELSSGRAYNTGQGLMALDASGRQVRALTNLGANTSVLFLPDCNCGRAGNQVGTVAPTTASCSAG